MRQRIKSDPCQISVMIMVTLSETLLRATWRKELLPFLLAFASNVEITSNLIKMISQLLFMAISTKLSIDADKQVR